MKPYSPYKTAAELGIDEDTRAKLYRAMGRLERGEYPRFHMDSYSTCIAAVAGLTSDHAHLTPALHRLFISWGPGLARNQDMAAKAVRAFLEGHSDPWAVAESGLSFFGSMKMMLRDTWRALVAEWRRAA